MESDRSVHRSIIWYLLKCDKSAAEIHRELVRVCGQDAPSDRTVRRWVEEFKSGKNSTEDAERAGRPVTSVTQVNTLEMEQLVVDSPRITIEELSQALGISRGSVQEIIHNELHMTKLTCRWVPKALTPHMKHSRAEICRELLDKMEEVGEPFLQQIVTGDEKWFSYYQPESKQESQEWRKVGSPPPLKIKTEPSTRKRMATVFWDVQGILLIEWLPEGTTVNSAYYCKILTKLKESIKSERRGKWTRGVFLLHDNARPHTAEVTQAKIRELGFTQLPHPPYSPDLAPSDYWLFGEMSKQTRGKRWTNIQELSGTIGRWVKMTQKDWFAKGLQQLPERWDRCVRLKGAYVEATEDSIPRD